jgi:hypothetical protein
MTMLLAVVWFLLIAAQQRLIAEAPGPGAAATSKIDNCA